jgi:ABC-type multidrug transport system fused ATPase/permease subunit
VRSGAYSQTQFFTVLPALLFSAQAAGQLFSLSPEIVRAKTAATSVFQLLSFKPTILEPDAVGSKEKGLLGSQHSQNTSHPNGMAKFEFEHVSFSYSANEEQKALDDVTLTINNCETVAFVGPSGAGKSSILALIERFYDPTDGIILFEGMDMREINTENMRQRMAVVPQEPELFPGSISYNITLGAGSDQIVTQDMVESVAKRCGLHDFISSLPDGYNTECCSIAASRFSGGQRQRLSLARALVRDPEVLILDEPMSALDATSEQQIQATLNREAKGRTTVIVSHRLSSIRDVDRIIVIDRGRVVEQGTHAHLVELGGLYASMARQGLA